ncbi:hypothetical protein GGF31_005068 [Allomyces arbusculus]|nr:hypothetical protein GGF31_005068 [Allomyces arbusculus]
MMTGLPTAPSAAANAVAPHPGATTRVTTMPDGPWRALRGAPPVLALDAYVPAADTKGKWAKREVRFDGRLLVCLDTTKHKAEFAMDAPVAVVNGGTVPDSALVLKRSSPLMATPEHVWEYWTAPVAHDAEDSSDDTSLGDVLATPVHLVAKHFQVPLWTMPVSAMAGVRVLVPPSSALPAAKRWRHPLTVAIDARYGRSQVLRPKSETDLHVLLYALQTAILAANAAAKPAATGPTESDRARAHRRGSPSPPRPRPVATGHQRTGSSSRSTQPPPRPRIWHWATVHGSPPSDAPQPDPRFFPICERDYPTLALNARRQMPFRLAVSIPPPRMFQGASKPQPLKNKSVSKPKPAPVPAEPEPEPAVAAPKPTVGGSVRTTPVLAPVTLTGTGSLPASTSNTPRPAAAARPRLHVPQLAVLPPSAVPLASPPHAATPPDAPAPEPVAQQLPPSLSLHLPPPLAVDDLDPSALYSQLMLLSPLLAEKRLSTLLLGKPPSPSFPAPSAPGSPAAPQGDLLALPLPPPIPANDELAGSDLPPRTVSLVAMSPRPRVQRRTGSPIARPRPLLEAAAAAASGGRGVPSIATSVHELLREGSEVGADISVILQLWQALGMPGTVGRGTAAAAAPAAEGGDAEGGAE